VNPEEHPATTTSPARPTAAARRARSRVFRGTGAPRVSLTATGTGAPRALRAYLALPVTLITLLATFGALTAQAAQAESPWFHLVSRVLPSHIAPGGEGTIVVEAINLGNQKTSASATLSDVLPAGLKLQEEDVEGKMVPAVSFFSSVGNKDFARATGEVVAGGIPLELCSASGQQVSCKTHSTNPAFKFLEEPPFTEPPFTTEPELIETIAQSIASTGIPPVLPYGYLEMRLKVKAEAEPAEPDASNEIAVSGGGAPAVTATRPLPISSEPVQFGVEDFSLQPEEEGGKPDTHAGSHPYQLTNVLTFNRSSEKTLKPPAIARNLHFQLPPGQIGNATAVEQCSDQEFAQIGESGEANACQGNTAIGVAVVTASTTAGQEEVFTVPLFNLTPATGEPARFGFEVLRNPVILDTALRDGPGEDYGVTVNVENITQLVGFQSATVTFWGTPEDQSHNEARGWGCLLGRVKAVGRPCIPSVEPHPAAFLTMPTNCTTPFAPTVSGESWPRKTSPESEPVAATFAPVEYKLQDEAKNPLSLTGCNQLAFSPTIKAEPTTDSASSPSGLDFNLNFDDEGLANGNGVAQSQLNKTEVTLPEGLTINPSAGVGLGGCTEADFARETLESEAGAGCPNDSKLGTVEIESPLLPQKQKVTGSIFIAQPYENPFPEPAAGHPNGTLVALYIVARNTEAGVLIKLAGKVTPNPVTGQLTTTFENNPQLPFDHFNFHFREGQQAPLISPPTCGAYNILAGLTPWSEPAAALTDASAFTITKGAEGGACPSGGAPFSPKIEAGTQNNNAGTFSPFYLHLTRTDAEQEISRFSTNLPPGLTGDLSGIPFCSDASIALARTKSGAQEEASPSCPAASQIGHTLVGTGVGAVLAYVPGKIYLAGAYGGDPLSIVSVTSAVVGPFDLGTVVIRFGLRIDPYTAQVSVDPSASEPIPTILDGIVTHVRDIRVYIERPGNAPFTLNPTNCTPAGIGSTLTSSLGVSSTITSPFQTASCANLKFAPKFAVSTSGKTSKAKGASLHVKLTYPNAPQGTYANITRVKVDLPKQLPSQLKTLQKACTAKQFELNPANCPKESMVGKAKAVTPLIPVPLEGPAIFVSHGNEAFPSLIMVLKGAPPYDITIDLVGSTFISKAGITSSTFKTVPDQPIGSFELTLPQGKFSALAANGNLCKSKLAMPTEFLAQNGAKINQSTKISVTGCPKAKKAKAKKKKKQSKSHKGSK
jgi:hypothetical protein